MSKKKSGQEIIADIIKNILRYRNDVKFCDRIIQEVALKTVQSTPVVEILTEIGAMRQLPQRGHDDLLLLRFIEMLAIINHMIDCQLLKQNLNDDVMNVAY